MEWSRVKLRSTDLWEGIERIPLWARSYEGVNESEIETIWKTQRHKDTEAQREAAYTGQ
jgi:hypothetical protein